MMAIFFGIGASMIAADWRRRRAIGRSPALDRCVRLDLSPGRHRDVRRMQNSRRDMTTRYFHSRIPPNLY